MNALRFLLPVVVLACWVPDSLFAEPSTSSPSESGRGSTLPLVSLPTADGNDVSLAPNADTRWQVICFLGSECPLAQLYGPRLQKMSDEFEDQGFRFIGINSNVQDSLDDVGSYVKDHNIRFPVGKDFDRRVAVAMAVTRTPEVFVLDKNGRTLYQGRIDDQYDPGISRPRVKDQYLRRALDELASGKTVSVPRVDSVGCLISLPKTHDETKTTRFTFARDISRVLNAHCIDCHRAGEIGPFSLEEYGEVVGWIDMMLEVIEDKRMPPWHATSDHLEFANARQMPEAAKQMLQDWADGGMPYGDVADLPKPKSQPDGWRLPDAPDAIFEMGKDVFEVPSMGTVEYQYYVVDPQFEEDKWVSAAQVIPGNASVVHHCIVFTRPPDGSDFSDFGMLSAFVPGQLSAPYIDGHALRVPAGSKIVFQMHYTPTGKPETDQTRIGLVFADPEEVTHEVRVIAGIQQDFEIPPNVARHKVKGRIGSFPSNGTLLSILPHMHVRGRSFELNCRLDSDKEEKTLLNVPAYDFNWQHSYDLRKPFPLRSVRSLDFVATFDNSDNNPTNPDHTEFVTWGDQTWQEMAVVFLVVATPLESDSKPESKSETDQDAEAAYKEHIARWEKLRAEHRAAGERFADRYIAKHDKNGDGSVATHELPNSVRRFGYLDHNGDSVVSRDELIDSYIWDQHGS